MLTGEIRSQIDQIWNAFWSGGISNPLEVIEQITYLLFLKRLDEQEIAEELKANREKKPMQKRFFPEGKDSKKRSFQDYRWNRFKNNDPRDMYTVVSEHVFPWLRTLGGNGMTFKAHGGHSLHHSHARAVGEGSPKVRSRRLPKSYDLCAGFRDLHRIFTS